VWKKGPQSGIKAVIARDTTCSVSLLTGPTGGSIFAFPSKKFRPAGTGQEFESAAVSGARNEPEVTQAVAADR